VHGPEAGHEVAQRLDVGLHGEVGREHVGAGLGGERLEPVGTPGDTHYLPAVVAEEANGGRPDS
jgi:hypothetical protein